MTFKTLCTAKAISPDNEACYVVVRRLESSEPAVFTYCVFVNGGYLASGEDGFETGDINEAMRRMTDEVTTICLGV